MRAKLVRLLRWAFHCLPEVMLVILLVALAPAVPLVAMAARAQGGALLDSPSFFWEGIRANPWPAAAVAVTVVGTLLLIVALWRNWIYVWAVARKMVIEALHRRIVLVLLIFVVVLTFLLPFVLETEGSITSQVQLVLLYSLVLAMVLLSLVAIFLSAASICSEIERKHIQVTDTKPMRRWQLLLGKWFGVTVLCTSVMFVMTTVAACLVYYLAREPDYDRMAQSEARRVQNVYEELRTEILVARQTVLPLPPPRLEELVRGEIARAKEAGQWPEGRRMRLAATKAIRKAFLSEYLTVPAGGSRIWQFGGLRPGDDGILQVRFHGYIGTPQGKFEGRWLVLRRELATDEDGNQSQKFVVLDEIYPPPYGWHSEVVPEFTIPARHVANDGTLFLAYENLAPGDTVFGGGHRTAVMQKVGGFLPNYYRALLVLLCHVALLTALGLMAGSVFSFPVAALTVVFFSVVGLVGPWFLSFLEPQTLGELTPLQEAVGTVWQAFWGALFTVVPHFGKYNPLGDLTDGKLVSWSVVFSSGAVMVYVKGTVALLVGMYFYSRRELARVIV